MNKKDDIQQQAFDELKKHKRASVGISMGVGKTKLGLMHMAYYYNDYSKFLVVAPKLSIFESWKDDAKKFGYEYLLDHITFSTYISLHKQDKDYDIVYLDECHSLTDTNDGFLSSYRNRIIGLTGTPPKRGEKYNMLNKYCPVVFTYFVDDAVKDKILNDYEINVHMLELSTRNTHKMEGKFGSFYTSEQKQYAYWNNKIQYEHNEKSLKFMRIMRMKTLMSFETKETYSKKLLSESKNKCIVFANTQKQADSLCKYSYHSSNKNSDDNLVLFKTGKIQRLSCVNQLSEGVTIPDLKEAIILHSYGGSSAKTKQRIGRVLRLNPDDKAIVHILCYGNTIDENWVKDALSDLDQKKIRYITVNQLLLNI